MKSISVRGFGLLEALVALVLLAGAGVALFTWMGSQLRTAAWLEDRREMMGLQRQALVWAQALNPAAQPQGEWREGDLRLRWRSELLEPPRIVLPTQPTDTARWEASLYRVTLEAERRTVASDVDAKLSTTLILMLPGLAPLGRAAAPDVPPP